MNRNVECDKSEAIPLDMKAGLGSNEEGMEARNYVTSSAHATCAG